MADPIYHTWLDFTRTQLKLRQTPQGYLPWETYLAEWTAQARLTLEDVRAHQYGAHEPIADHGGHLSEQSLKEALPAMYNTQIPPRYVAKEMAAAWRNTKTPVLTWNHPFVLPGYILFLPLPTDSDLDTNSAPLWAGLREYYLISLMVLHSSSGLVTYFCVGDYDEQADMINLNTGKQTVFPDQNYDIKGIDSLVREVASVAINSWLVHSYEPELIEEVPVASVARGFGRSTGKRSRIAPTWIGRNFKIRRESSPAPREETGITVRPHWRSGHWHTVRHGKGKEHTRTQWYRPTYVNADS